MGTAWQNSLIRFTMNNMVGGFRLWNEPEIWDSRGPSWDACLLEEKEDDNGNNRMILSLNCHRQDIDSQRDRQKRKHYLLVRRSCWLQRSSRSSNKC